MVTLKNLQFFNEILLNKFLYLLNKKDVLAEKEYANFDQKTEAVKFFLPLTHLYLTTISQCFNRFSSKTKVDFVLVKKTLKKIQFRDIFEEILDFGFEVPIFNPTYSSSAPLGL